MSDYPLTQEVVELREPRAVAVDEPAADARVTALLHELGFEALLILPLVVADGCWAIVEVYGRDGKRFGAGDAELASALVRRAAELLAGLERGPAPA